MNAVRTVLAGLVIAAVSAAAGFLAGVGLHGTPEPPAPAPVAKPVARTERAEPAPPTDSPRAKTPPGQEPPAPATEEPTGLRSEHDIERILRSHLKRDPPTERVREVVVLRQALFDAQRRVPQDWEDEALRRVIRSVRGEVPPLSQTAAAEAAQVLRAARSLEEPLFFAVSDGPHFARLFEPASDGVRVDVTKPPPVLRTDQPLVLLFPEGVHEWDGRVADRGSPERDVVFQGAGMDTTLLRLRKPLSDREGVAVVLRDLTLLPDRAPFGDRPSQRLRLERCRLIGWEGRNDPLFEGFEGLVLASDCRFEGGYAEQGTAAILDRGARSVLGRFERCRFRGPLQLGHSSDGWISNFGRGTTWLFDSCAFLEMERPTPEDLERPRRDAVRFDACLPDPSDSAKGVRRSLADLNPDWASVR